MPKNSTIGGLGEIAFRVNDLKTMTRFYEEVIGLEVMSRNEHMSFFKIAEGYAGHTQILALFDRQRSRSVSGQPIKKPYVAPSSAESTVDHIAFSIDRKDFNNEQQRLQGLGLQVDVTYHDWVQWRSLFIEDPEGNTVEFVCFDPQEA